MKHAKEKKQQRTEEIFLEKLNRLENLLKRKDDKPLSFKEACAYLGFAPSYLYKLTYRKVIPHYKPTGKMLFFSKVELDSWIFTKSQVSSEKLKSPHLDPLPKGEENNIEEEDEEPP